MIFIGNKLINIMAIDYTEKQFLDKEGLKKVFELIKDEYSLKEGINEKIIPMDDETIESIYEKACPCVMSHQTVDLGLPSGLLWATCNIGACSPEEAGLYFHWAGTKGITAEQATTDDYYKTWCTWENTPCSNGTGLSYSDAKLTKYCGIASFGNEGFTDDLTILEPMDDAATQILGDGWRMPTTTEITELVNNTNQEWVDDYKGTGVSGKLFKGKDSYSDRELFIPACGSVTLEGVEGVGSVAVYGLVHSATIILPVVAIWLLTLQMLSSPAVSVILDNLCVGCVVDQSNNKLHR